MENASKALILAASVLVAILIVAMGVTIFNRARNSADVSSLDQTEINMFNSKFEKYSGSQLGSQVKSLVSFAISNANTNQDDPAKLPNMSLVLNGGSGETPYGTAVREGNDITTFTNIRNNISSTHSYWVEVHYGTKTGLVDSIAISWNKP